MSESEPRPVPALAPQHYSAPCIAWPATRRWRCGIDVLLILLFGLLSTNQLFLSLVSLQNIGFNAAQIVLLAVAATFELAGGANRHLARLQSSFSRRSSAAKSSSARAGRPPRYRQASTLTSPAL